MSEAVEMIISADDQASKKFAQVAANAEKDLGRIKDAGSKLKGSAAVGGSLVKMLGGTELGSTISQFGELSEKVNQFGEVAKMGTAGSVAFKAGLVGLVGVASFQVGQALGNLIFNTKQYEEQMEKARLKIKELAAESRSLSQQASRGQVADLELIRDPEQKGKAIEQMLQTAQNEVESVTSMVRESQNAVDGWAKAWKVTGDRKGFEKQAQDQLAEDKERLALKRQELQSLQQMREERDRSAKIKEAEKSERVTADFESMRQALRQESVLLFSGAQAANNYALELKGFSFAQIAAIEEIQKSNDAMKKENAEKEKALQLAARVSESYANAASSIQKQRIALTEGEEAGRKFELVQQGMSDAMAERIAEEEAQLRASIATQEKQKDLASKAKEFNDQLKERRILLQQGEEAAKAFNLEQQGFDKATAAKMAREDAELRKAEQAKQQLAGMNTAFGPVEARESRTLSGRSASVENATKAQLQTLIEIHNAIIDQTKNNRVRLVQVNR